MFHLNGFLGWKHFMPKQIFSFECFRPVRLDFVPKNNFWDEIQISPLKTFWDEIETKNFSSLNLFGDKT